MYRQPFGVSLLLAFQQRLFGDALATALARAGFDVDVTDRCDLASLEPCDPPRTALVDLHRREHIGPIADLTRRARVIVLAADVDDDMIAQVVARGCSGVVSLDATLEDLRQAILAVGDGATVVRGVALKQLFRGVPAAHTDTQPGARKLTDREISILALLTEGASTSEVAAELGITTNTARTHIQRILGKLEVHSRLEASALATREGLV